MPSRRSAGAARSQPQLHAAYCARLLPSRLGVPTSHPTRLDSPPRDGRTVVPWLSCVAVVRAVLRCAPWLARLGALAGIPVSLVTASACCALSIAGDGGAPPAQRPVGVCAGRAGGAAGALAAVAPAAPPARPAAVVAPVAVRAPAAALVASRPAPLFYSVRYLVALGRSAGRPSTRRARRPQLLAARCSVAPRALRGPRTPGPPATIAVDRG